MKGIYIDCFLGVNLDMLLGALIDAGVPTAFLKEQFQLLFPQGVIAIRKVRQNNVLATRVSVSIGKEQYVLQSEDDIISMIYHSRLEDRIKEQLVQIFRTMWFVKKKITGDKQKYDCFCSIDDIYLVLGIVLSLDFLEISKVFVSNINVGSGFLKMNQEYLPVPDPITAELLKEIPFIHSEEKVQLINPVCAALLNKIGKFSANFPNGFTVEKIAYGAGKKALKKLPNLLRVYIGNLEISNDHHDVKIVETNIDDLNPQFYSYVMEILFKMGALDVYLTPIIMKKGRPGTKVTIAVQAKDIPKIAKVMFAETTTIGLKVVDCTTIHMNRQLLTVDTPWGKAHVKVSRWNGEIMNIAPEYEDCKLFAEQNNVSVKDIFWTIKSIATENLQNNKN